MMLKVNDKGVQVQITGIKVQCNLQVRLVVDQSHLIVLDHHHELEKFLFLLIKVLTVLAQCKVGKPITRHQGIDHRPGIILSLVDIDLCQGMMFHHQGIDHLPGIILSLVDIDLCQGMMFHHHRQYANQYHLHHCRHHQCMSLRQGIDHHQDMSLRQGIDHHQDISLHLHHCHRQDIDQHQDISLLLHHFHRQNIESQLLQGRNQEVIDLEVAVYKADLV